MKILLVGNYRLDAIESMERFASLLRAELLQLGYQVYLIRPALILGKLSFKLKRLEKWFGYIDKLIFFPFQLKKAILWADVVHICDHGNAIYIRYLNNAPHIVTCHDLLAIRSGLGEFSEYQTGWTGKKLQKMILKGLSQAQHIACVSEHTKKDVLRLCSVRADVTSRIYMGLNYPYTFLEKTESEKCLSSLGITPDFQFFLHVGANHWYKNRLGMISIFHHLTLQSKEQNLYLIMVGKPFTIEMQQKIKQYNLSERIIELINVKNEDLQALYSSAVGLIFPSLQEGFGWPIIEAQACCCPIFTSDRPPMTEVAGQGAVYFDPENHQEAAEKIIYYSAQRQELIVKGFTNLERFTTRKMILAYIDLYQRVSRNMKSA
ncbi:MAG: glycosyltransferase family 4 protein [Microcoleaceae cyanobacterium]